MVVSTPFTEAEMEKINSKVAAFGSADEVAAEVGVHRDTLRRRLLRHHGIEIERISACRLVPVGTKTKTEAAEKAD